MEGVYELRCAVCGAKQGLGYSDAVTWWEGRCWHTGCHVFFHFKTYPTSPVSGIVIELRCPHCQNKYGHGQFGPHAWLEVKCRRCSQYYHLGAYGRGLPAQVSEFCVASLAPDLRGPFLQARRIGEPPFVSAPPLRYLDAQPLKIA